MKTLLIIALIAIALLFAQSTFAKRSGGLSQGKLQHDGLKRNFLYYIPPAAKNSTKVPLVLVFHGGGGNSKGIAKSTAMHELAKKEGFIVVYPDGTGKGKKHTWNGGLNPPQGYAEQNNIDDVGFISELLDYFEKNYPVDKKRVYATGLSKGGMFSYRLGCEMSDRFAAIAPVAATLTLDSCQPSQPIALLHVHGKIDQNVPFDGGKGKYTARAVKAYPAAIDGIGVFCKASGAKTTTKEKTISSDTRCYTFENGSVPIEYCLIEGSAHGWPGSKKKQKKKHRKANPITQSFSASELIWSFFSKQTL